ncbi:hypothetical protein AB838_02155 [Rhodobacteraceae bacterium (ex Bugula neritina AB1)]|nr:hypothetical protein AB833_28605 [Chromatiales bacterium (ex Bugula neritina AB1)]OED50434.1 hypothetical protein AB838_02155 [Rhodobacteraceae bacterium (ex Bugula neritina AB1)]
MENKILLLLLSLLASVPVHSTSLHREIEQQWHNNTLNVAQLTMRYTDYCLNSEFQFARGTESEICTIVGNELVASSLKRAVTLDQYIELTSCGSDEHDQNNYCYYSPEEVLSESLYDAIAVALCQVEPTSVKRDPRGVLQKNGVTIYDDGYPQYNCRNDEFVSGERDSRFTTRPNTLGIWEAPALVEWLLENIKNDNEPDFLVNIEQHGPRLIDTYGVRLLRSAVESGNDIYFRTLLALGVAVNDNGEYSDHPLSLAISANNNDAALVLLAEGANTQLLTSYDKSSLTQAVIHSSVDVIEQLLINGARADGQLEFVDKTLASPMEFAAVLGRYEVMTLLVEYGASIESTDSTSLRYGWLKAAARGGDEKIFADFVSSGATLPKNTSELFEAIVRGGSLKILKMAVDLGIKVTSENRRDIFSAFVNATRGYGGGEIHSSPYKPEGKYQRLSQLQYLLSDGLRFKGDDNLAHDFVSRLNFPYYEPTDKYGAELKSRSVERQQLALKSIEVAVKSGVDIDYLDEDNRTFVITAAIADNLQAVELLVELGADPSVKKKGRKTAREIVGIELAKLLERSPEEKEKIAAFRRTYKILGGDIETLPPAPEQKKSLYLELLRLLG